MGKLLNLITGGNKTGGTNGTTHFSKVVCKDCHTEYAIPISANFMYFCPKCRKLIGFECEYGFADIAPCEIYLGEKRIGRLTRGAEIPGSFFLECRPIGIGTTQLTGGYRNEEVYDEAAELITGKLAGR